MAVPVTVGTQEAKRAGLLGAGCGRVERRAGAWIDVKIGNVIIPALIGILPILAADGKAYFAAGKVDPGLPGQHHIRHQLGSIGLRAGCLEEVVECGDVVDQTGTRQGRKSVGRTRSGKIGVDRPGYGIGLHRS